MKTLFGKCMALACGLVVAASFTACHHDDEPFDYTKTETVEAETTNTLIVNLTKEVQGVTLTYNGARATTIQGTTYVFENAAATGTVTLGGPVIAQNVNVKFGEEKTVTIEIDVVTASTPVASTEVENGAIVSNDSDNADDTGVSASLSLGDSEPTYDPNNDDTNYSVTVFTPANGDGETAENEEVEAVPYALACTPDGAKFSGEGIKVELTLPDMEGFDVIVRDQNKQKANKVAMDGNKLTAYLPHFSVWDIIVMATNIGKQKVTDEVLATGTITKGQTVTIKYKKIIGFETEEEKNSITYKFLKSYLGATKTSISRTARYSATFNGTYTVTQPKYLVTFRTSGNNAKIFSAYIWGSPQIKATPTNTPTPTHNGGSN